jgi:hypothetical protein
MNDFRLCYFCQEFLEPGVAQRGCSVSMALPAPRDAFCNNLCKHIQEALHSPRFDSMGTINYKGQQPPKQCGTAFSGVTDRLLGCAVVSAMTTGRAVIALLVLHTAAAMPILASSSAFCSAPAIGAANLHLGGANIRTVRPDIVSAGAGTFGFDDDEKSEMAHPLAQTVKEFTRVYTGAFAEHALAAFHHSHAKNAIGILPYPNICRVNR